MAIPPNDIEKTADEFFPGTVSEQVERHLWGESSLDRLTRQRDLLLLGLALATIANVCLAIALVLQ